MIRITQLMIMIFISMVKATKQAPTDSLVSELTFEFTADIDEIPNDAVYISPVVPSNDASNYVKQYTYLGGYNSTTNTCLVGMPTSGGAQLMGASLNKSNHNKTVTIKLSSTYFHFDTGQNVELYCIYPEVL